VKPEIVKTTIGTDLAEDGTLTGVVMDLDSEDVFHVRSVQHIKDPINKEK